MRTLLAGLLACAATVAAADFDVDLEAPDVRRMAGQFVVADLAIGESGLLSFVTLCRADRGLYVWAMDPLYDSIHGDGGFKVRREPDGRVSLDVQMDETSTMTVKQFLLTTIAVTRECHVFQPYGPERFQVISIDGEKSLTEILGMRD